MMAKLKVTLCRLPHNKILGIAESPYPLWMGYLSSAILDLCEDSVELTVVDGETLQYGQNSLISQSRFLNRALVAFFPRLLQDQNWSSLKDFTSNPLNPAWQVFLAEVTENAPDLVAVSSYTNETLSLGMFSRKVKEALPHTKILVGGIHATVEYESLAKQIPEIDYCCVGEGEVTFRECVLALASGKGVEDVPGLFSSRSPVKFTPRPLVQDIDTIAPPKRDLLSQQHYRPEYHIFSSRGCPFRCNFCSSHRLWSRTPRFHSADRVMGEIRHIVDDLGGYRIIFVDDTFTLKRSRVLDLANRITSDGYDKLNIHVGARIDTVDENLLDSLAKAGVKSMSFGIETGSERLQQLIGKNLTRERIIRILRHARSVGIHTLTYYMVGHPTETEEDVDSSIALLKAAGAHKATVCAAQPLPGTDLCEQARRQRFVLTPELAFSMEQRATPTVNLTQMDEETLNRKVRDLYKVANRRSQIGRVRQAVNHYWNRLKWVIAR